jgi:hypothetical protein
MSIGRSLVTVAWGFKKGLYDAASTALGAEGSYISMGMPQTLDPNEIVSIGLVRVQQSPAVYGTNREREEVLTCEITVTVFQGGMDEAQLAVSQRAWELLGMIEKQVHYIVAGVDGTLLGGVVRECFLTDAAEDSTAILTETSRGREAVIIATFTGKARVTWAP